MYKVSVIKNGVVDVWTKVELFFLLFFDVVFFFILNVKGVIGLLLRIIYGRGNVIIIEIGFEIRGRTF